MEFFTYLCHTIKNKNIKTMKNFKNVKEGKADVYGATTFEDAFNNDYISDRGIIKIFKNTTPNF